MKWPLITAFLNPENSRRFFVILGNMKMKKNGKISISNVVIDKIRVSSAR
jgi:hypothetical protein